MKKSILMAAFLSAALGASALAADAAFSVDSEMGKLVGNPAAKEVINKHLPGIVDNPQMEQAAAMTLRSLQQFIPTLTEEKMKEIDADLAKVK